MITISLDEYGEFEKEENKPLFVAGLIFDDKEKDSDRHVEESIERERVRAYYKRAIADAGEGFVYPNDLHSNGDKKRDKNVIAPVKDMVAKTLPEFISKGTYLGETLCNEKGQKIRERKGEYHLFVILKSDDGKRKLLSERANMLVKDDWAANRYFHMASSVVNRMIFHNPLYATNNMPAISIDIATRSTGDISELDSTLVSEFKKQAYKANEVDSSNFKYYSIMNADIYRTLIAQEMINSGNINIKLEKLYVKSIQYDASKSMMEFLYLSDSICSILGYKLEGDSANQWLEELIKRTDSINSTSENLIFGYDEIDNEFAEAWAAYERKDLFDALSRTYDAKIKKGRFAEHYNSKWFPYLEERIRNTISPELFNKSVNELASMLTINNLDQEKLLYLMQQFEAMVPMVVDKYRSVDMKSTVLYKLYDAGVSAFCHIGNSKKALEYYEKCQKYAFYIGIDAFLRTNNKLVVCLEDCFEWEKALEIANENVSNQELASEMKRAILNNGDESDFLDEAKAISQKARILAEMRCIEAEECFRKALDMLEKGSANYKITQSYLLHFYADNGMKDKFEEELKDYFDGKSTYNQMLRYIVGFDEDIHSTFSNEYALYVLIRGLCQFNKDSIDGPFWDKLCSLPEMLEKKDGKAPYGHPWEIIYKYLEIIALYRKDNEAADKFEKLRHESLTYRGEIIIALDKYSKVEIDDYVGDYESRDEASLELVEYLKENFEIINEVAFSENGDERYKELGRYFTFMYR